MVPLTQSSALFTGHTQTSFQFVPQWNLIKDLLRRDNFPTKDTLLDTISIAAAHF